MKTSRIAYFLIVLALLIAGAQVGAAVPKPLSFRHDMLTIRTSSGPRQFSVEIAETPKQQERGLMYRKTLGPDHGMLFIMPGDRNVQMWMKNTDLSLDMLFIDAKGNIIFIASRAQPYSTDVITAGRPVRAVLELSGGIAEKDGIQVGDTVKSTWFAP